MVVPPTSALSRYTTALKHLKKKSLSEALALEILSAREQLQLSLSSQTSIPVRMRRHIKRLDSFLMKQAYKLNEAVDLREWRIRSTNQTDDWIWNLETKGAKHPLKQYDWLFKGLRLAVWTFSLALLGDVVPRFVSGGLTVLGSWEIIVPSLLTLLTAGSDLTQVGKKGWEKLIRKIGLRQHYQEISLFGLILTLLILVVSFRASLPKLSQRRNQEGVDNYNQGKLGVAEEDYLRAIAFDPDNYDAHYNIWLEPNYRRQIKRAKKTNITQSKFNGGIIQFGFTNISSSKLG